MFGYSRVIVQPKRQSRVEGSGQQKVTPEDAVSLDYSCNQINDFTLLWWLWLSSKSTLVLNHLSPSPCSQDPVCGYTHTTTNGWEVMGHVSTLFCSLVSYSADILCYATHPMVAILWLAPKILSKNSKGAPLAPKSLETPASENEQVSELQHSSLVLHSSFRFNQAVGDNCLNSLRRDLGADIKCGGTATYWKSFTYTCLNLLLKKIRKLPLLNKNARGKMSLLILMDFALEICKEYSCTHECN